LTALAFVVGAVSGALSVTLAGFGLGFLVPRLVASVGAVAITIWSVWWHLRGRVRFPGDRDGVQANKELARTGLSGSLYFGLLLGFGFLTRMATPLWYALPFLAAAGSLAGALALGVGVGLGRSWPVGRAVMDSGKDQSGVVARSLALTARQRTDALSAVAAAAFVVAALALRIL
jgi:hypothetical protein